ncbi:hypothetical protein CSKR_101870 [Clonorchis sinensis]|uniref:Uncharacterized protein n=1 Tax=Clonorchis sinensis TaxID=79923 RepID=A0A419QB85_CLOSI|nr:hypothetical protein CSKR_101870 [Clonorchis sinensis]
MSFEPISHGAMRRTFEGSMIPKSFLASILVISPEEGASSTTTGLQRLHPFGGHWNLNSRISSNPQKVGMDLKECLEGCQRRSEMTVVQQRSPEELHWRPAPEKSRWNSTQIRLYRPQSGAASAKKPIPHKIGQEFETLAGPASSPDMIGRKSGPNRQS